MERTAGPTAIALTRQNVPVLPPEDVYRGGNVFRGAYILKEGGSGHPAVILLASGSEGRGAPGAAKLLEAEGISARVVSFPCRERFEEQDDAYRRFVLPPSVRARVSVEAAATFGWERYVGDGGADGGG